MASSADVLLARTHPQLQPAFRLLLQIALLNDPGARLTSAYRSPQEQERLYRRYLAGASQFPVAPPGRSKHEQGRAIDLVAKPEVLRGLGALWESWGGRWGGRFDDPIHFEA